MKAPLPFIVIAELIEELLQALPYTFEEGRNEKTLDDTTFHDHFYLPYKTISDSVTNSFSALSKNYNEYIRLQ